MLDNQQKLIDAGWNVDMAEALDERGFTVETAQTLSTNQAMTEFLEWNGVVGFTRVIVNALDNIRNMKAL